MNQFKSLIRNSLFLILAVSFLIPQTARAEVVAIAVGEKSWTIDSDTAARGITLGSDNGMVQMSIAPDAALPDTKVTITTFASDHFVKNGSTHRITPLYRIEMTLVSKAGGAIPLEIKYPAEELGKKTVRIWDDDGNWAELPTQSIPEKNVARVKITALPVYAMVFSDDQVLESGMASWYNYKKCHCAASPDYPKGTKLKVTNMENGKQVVVRVNDFGPERMKFPDRVIDLDYQSFIHIANPKHGLARVKVEPIL